MKYFIILTSLLFFSCKTLNNQNQKACDEFLLIYNNLVKFKENNYTGTIFNSDVRRLVELTGIKCDYLEGIDIRYQPSEQNLIDWKVWYEKNKDRLYWDEIVKKVKVKNGNIPN